MSDLSENKDVPPKSPTPPKSTKESIDELIEDIKEFYNLVYNPSYGDNEKNHCVEDDILHTFVDLIAKNKLSPSKARYIARLIKSHVLDVEYERWYA